MYSSRMSLPLVDCGEYVSTYLKDHHKAYNTLRNSLERLQGQVDFVLFDQANAFSPVMDAMLIASDEMLIPCELEPYAVQARALRHVQQAETRARAGAKERRHHSLQH